LDIEWENFEGIHSTFKGLSNKGVTKMWKEAMKSLKHPACKHASVADAKFFERMEWFGDSVLDWITSQRLLETFPDDDEGQLTLRRSEAVEGRNLVIWAKRVHLPEEGARTIFDGLRNDLTDSMIEDSVEAIIGYLFQLHGMDVARQVINDIIASCMNKDRAMPINPRRELQAFCKQHHINQPQFVVSQIRQPDSVYPLHVVTIQLSSEDNQVPEVLAKTRAHKRKFAETDAAMAALQVLKNRYETGVRSNESLLVVNSTPQRVALTMVKRRKASLDSSKNEQSNSLDYINNHKDTNRDDTVTDDASASRPLPDQPTSSRSKLMNEIKQDALFGSPESKAMGDYSQEATPTATGSSTKTEITTSRPLIREALERLVHPASKRTTPSERLFFQRQELLGDAVLDLATTEKLMEAFPNADEGEITLRRARAVEEKTLAAWATRVHLLQDAEHTFQQNSATVNARMLADTVEAMIGVIYREHGPATTSVLIGNIVADSLDETHPTPLTNFNAKGDLQGMVQRLHGHSARVEYILLEESGSKTDPSYTMGAKVEGEVLGLGTGRTKKVAEKEAAIKAIAVLLEREQDHSTDSAPAEVSVYRKRRTNTEGNIKSNDGVDGSKNQDWDEKVFAGHSPTTLHALPSIQATETPIDKPSKRTRWDT
jgi:ribonuclease-3